jgi:hypothetical protein
MGKSIYIFFVVTNMSMHTISKKIWMQQTLDAMCYPRYLKRFAHPLQRDIQFKWGLEGASGSPTYDLLLKLDKQPYPLGFTCLKSFWGDHGKYCHEVACAIKIDLMRMGQNGNDWKWIIAKDCIFAAWHSWLEHEGWAIDATEKEIVVSPVDVKRNKPPGLWVAFYEGPRLGDPHCQEDDMPLPKPPKPIILSTVNKQRVEAALNGCMKGARTRSRARGLPFDLTINWLL